MKDFVAESAPVLRTPAEPVTFPLSAEIKQLTEDMRQFLINSQNEEIAAKYDLRAGVGLAAPQLGVNKQIFAIYMVDEDEEGNIKRVIMDQIFINPKIQSHSVQQVALQEGEGCLSVPREVPGIVPRPKRVKFTFQDLNGQEYTLKLSDFMAIVIQHELDHLKGVMFYDHINPDNPWDSTNIELI